jgi:hypothetical protein
MADTLDIRGRPSLDHLCSLIKKIIIQRPHLRLTLENGSQRKIDIALYRMSRAR